MRPLLPPPPHASPQSADPQHLLLAAVPFSERAGKRVLLVYDASSTGEVSPSGWRQRGWLAAHNTCAGLRQQASQRKLREVTPLLACISVCRAAQANQMATRLTTRLHEGLKVEVGWLR